MLNVLSLVSVNEVPVCAHPLSSILFWQPGKGNFIVRVTGVEVPIVELKAMSRPFPPLKALDMEEVSRQVLAALAT
jgi:hypothetical protein